MAVKPIYTDSPKLTKVSNCYIGQTRESCNGEIIYSVTKPLMQTSIVQTCRMCKMCLIWCIVKCVLEAWTICIYISIII